MDAIERTILRQLLDGPRWARSFQYVKPYVQGLCDEGLIECVKPPLGRGANMLALTKRGREGLAA